MKKLAEEFFNIPYDKPTIATFALKHYGRDYDEFKSLWTDIKYQVTPSLIFAKSLKYECLEKYLKMDIILLTFLEAVLNDRVSAKESGTLLEVDSIDFYLKNNIQIKISRTAGSGFEVTGSDPKLFDGVDYSMFKMMCHDIFEHYNLKTQEKLKQYKHEQYTKLKEIL